MSQKNGATYDALIEGLVKVKWFSDVMLVKKGRNQYVLLEVCKSPKATVTLYLFTNKIMVMCHSGLTHTHSLKLYC